MHLPWGENKVKKLTLACLMQRVSLTLSAQIIVHVCVRLHQTRLHASLPPALPVLALDARLGARSLVFPDAQWQRCQASDGSFRYLEPGLSGETMAVCDTYKRVEYCGNSGHNTQLYCYKTMSHATGVTNAFDRTT